MKKLLILLLIVSGANYTYSQRILPTAQANRIETILLQEGMPYLSSSFFSGNIPSANQGNVGAMIGNFGTPYVILNGKGIITSTKDVLLYSATNGDITVGNSTLSSYLIPAGGLVNIEYQTPMWPLSAGFSIYGDAAQSGTPVKIGFHFSGIKILNDLNFNAKRKIFWMGDSVTDFTANAIGTSNFYQFQVRDWLTKNSTIGDYRLTQKAWGGRTSNDFNKLLINGSLYVESPNFIFYQLGINDANQAIGTTAYVANMQRIIAYKQTYWKDAILVFLGSTTVQLSSRETTLDTYRTAMANMVTAANDPKVKYISLANAYDRTATPATIWAASDIALTSTDALHPGTLLSHTGIANTITSAISSWGITF